MLILNHPLITPLKIIYADSKETITHSLSRDFLLLCCKDFQETLNLAQFCSQNNLDYAAFITSIKEALFLVNLNARFLLCVNLEFAQKVQKLAESYLFDTKILLCLKENDWKNQEDKLEYIALCGIDGVIFADF